jgi:Family of unknown function (DUF5996)
VLLPVDRVLKQFRTGYFGKIRPVHLSWGSFDLAVTRFSGRRAPQHPNGVPGFPVEITGEAYSHEVSSAGFWPGGGPVEYPAFYAYATPRPEAFSSVPVEPKNAFYHKEMGEFILPYDTVRTADSPDVVLLEFLQSTYQAAVETRGGILRRWIVHWVRPVSLLEFLGRRKRHAKNFGDAHA